MATVAASSDVSISRMARMVTPNPHSLESSDGLAPSPAPRLPAAVYRTDRVGARLDGHLRGAAVPHVPVDAVVAGRRSARPVRVDRAAVDRVHRGSAGGRN